MHFSLVARAVCAYLRYWIFTVLRLWVDWTDVVILIAMPTESESASLGQELGIDRSPPRQ